MHVGASPLQGTQAQRYLAQRGLTSWREDPISYPGASLLEGASPNSWRCMLTGTDCARKCNKPQAAGICLHHRDWRPGSGMCEAPAADIFSCWGTKCIRLQTGTARGPSTRLRFHPGGTGGPGTVARQFSSAGRAGATQSSHPSRGDGQPTHNTEGEGKQAGHHHIPLPVPLSVCLCMLSAPHSLSQAVRPHVPMHTTALHSCTVL